MEHVWNSSEHHRSKHREFTSNNPRFCSWILALLHLTSSLFCLCLGWEKQSSGWFICLHWARRDNVQRLQGKIKIILYLKKFKKPIFLSKLFQIEKSKSICFASRNVQMSGFIFPKLRGRGLFDKSKQTSAMWATCYAILAPPCCAICTSGLPPGEPHGHPQATWGL